MLVFKKITIGFILLNSFGCGFLNSYIVSKSADTLNGSETASFSIKPIFPINNSMTTANSSTMTVSVQVDTTAQISSLATTYKLYINDVQASLQAGATNIYEANIHGLRQLQRLL